MATPRLARVLLGLALSIVGCQPQAGPDGYAGPPPRPTKTRSIELVAEDPHWAYVDPNGPSMWGSLSPKWSVCGQGHGQSPIDVGRFESGPVPPMSTQFAPAELKVIHQEHTADVLNTGHTIQVNYSAGDTLKLGDEEFTLKQWHFHAPSEHTVHGEHFPVEMHLVHQSKSGGLAVVGVFLEVGPTPHYVIAAVLRNIPPEKGMELHFEHVLVDVTALLPKDTSSYRYSGSLTTPPCSEGVRWVLLTTPIQISAQQAADFAKILDGNNRPTQPRNGRRVFSDRVEPASEPGASE